MLIIPAIDLKNGKCVRLLQGEEHQETIYSDDPVAMAKSFEEAGAKRLHLVDLDGAFRGKSENLNRIEQVVRAIQIPVELGGGIRTQEDVRRVFDLGVQSVIVGTMAVKEPQRLKSILQIYTGESILLGIDAKQRKVAISGWKEKTEWDDVEFAKYWKERGIQRIIFTDISRDGMLSGPNLEALEDFAKRTGMKVTASGGVSKIQDVYDLQNLENHGVDQVIIGKAIYEGNIQLSEINLC